MNSVDRGFRSIIHDHRKFTHKLGYMATQLGATKGDRVWSNLLKNMVLQTEIGAYVIVEVLFRQAGLVGRLTYVVKAHHQDRPTETVVIKISCPSLSREPEEKLVNAARDAAIEIGGESHWVLKHLPKIVHAEDIETTPGSTQDRVASFLNKEASYVDGGKYHYEYRTLHIVILEELFSINKLSCASDFAQVFFDVLNCHKWLHDVPRILHRDISMSNIMYRYHDGAVCGVLNDMDLSSLVADLEQQKATSSMRTGTPPFMAVDLLGSHKSGTVHLYRHDLESLFYVMLILSTRHRISYNGIPRANNLVKRVAPPFSEWFKSSLTWEQLGAAKDRLIFKGFPSDDPTMSLDKLFPPDSSFIGFRNWIIRLRAPMKRGFEARVAYDDELALAQAEGVEFDSESVDEKTLGKNIQYSAFFAVMKSFAGKALRAPPVNLDTL
ncbi:hypothetical protein CPB85DRAFT_1295455 [Mucidula mucida]|nr:hypothetical protein CPB85DRAFT_1295455 [Mucidula mucida]